VLVVTKNRTMCDNVGDVLVVFGFSVWVKPLEEAIGEGVFGLSFFPLPPSSPPPSPFPKFGSGVCV
jgi:hypothetical protein